METKSYCAAFYQTSLEEGLTPTQISALLSRLDTKREVEFFMVDASQSVARGFVDLTWFEEVLEFDGHRLHAFISSVLEDIELETASGEYELESGTLYLSYPANE